MRKVKHYLSNNYFYQIIVNIKGLLNLSKRYQSNTVSFDVVRFQFKRDTVRTFSLVQGFPNFQTGVPLSRNSFFTVPLGNYGNVTATDLQQDIQRAYHEDTYQKG